MITNLLAFMTYVNFTYGRPTKAAKLSYWVHLSRVTKMNRIIILPWESGDINWIDYIKYWLYLCIGGGVRRDWCLAFVTVVNTKARHLHWYEALVCNCAFWGWLRLHMHLTSWSSGHYLHIQLKCAIYNAWKVGTTAILGSVCFLALDSWMVSSSGRGSVRLAYRYRLRVSWRRVILREST